MTLERSRSLPSRTSPDSRYTSLSKSDVPSFQQRRKTAAKLTQFFGVDYKVLINDVLESIENRMQVDQGEGLLATEEFEVCIFNLRQRITRLISIPCRFRTSFKSYAI